MSEEKRVEVRVVDWRNAYQGVTLIWPDLRTCRAQSINSRHGRHWRLSGKNLDIYPSGKLVITVGRNEYSITADDYKEDGLVGGLYIISTPADAPIAILPTEIWSILECRTKGANTGERVIPGDPTALFAAAGALASELKAIPLRYTGVGDKPGNPSWFVEADRQNTSYHLKDALNRIAEAILKARSPEFLATTLLNLLQLQSTLAQ
jgi:hypothetical protein